jgi:hypothetical protein
VLVALFPAIFKGIRLVVKAVGLVDSVLDEFDRENQKEQDKLAGPRRKMSEIYVKVSNSAGKEKASK